MNDYLDEAALKAMAVLLQHDIEKCIEDQKGPEWIAKVAYQIAQTMNAERTVVMTRIYDGR
jgi:hypothetical protein